MIWNHAYPAGFPDFRFTLHAKQSGKKKKLSCFYTNCISSSCSLSINVCVLRTNIYVARLCADQRKIQKKDEHRFSIFNKGQHHKEVLTGQTSEIVLNLNPSRT